MNRRSMSCMASGILALVAGTCSVSLWAEEVILEPGWIAGQASVATDGQIVQSVSMNAYGGGHTASKSVSQSYTGELTPLDYSMTVQGGDWDYRVVATATARTDPKFCPEHAPSCSGAYTNIYFSDRYFPVAVDQTVSNSYAATGTIQFTLDISDLSESTVDSSITGWRAYGYAYRNVAAGEERTNSRSYTHSSYTPCATHTGETPCGLWDMPVVGNTEVRVYASVTVYGNALRADGTTYSYSKSYSVHTASDDLLYVDVGTDETNEIVIVPLTVEHVAPPPPPIPPIYDYGTVEGTVDLNLTVDGIDYSDLFFTYPTWPYSYHNVWGRNIYTNPGDYQANVRTRTYTYRPTTRLWDDNRWLYLYWPYTDGDPAKNRVTVIKDQTERKDFMNETGILTGQLLFNGSLKTRDLDWYRLYAVGARYYQLGVGWINQPTYGGSSEDTIYANDEDKSYRMFLTPGPWQPYRLQARATNTVLLGYSGWSDITMYDYNNYYDGNTYDFGQPVDVIGGLSKNKNLNYKIGGVSMCFEVAGGGSLRSPYVSGRADIYNKDGKREMYVNVSGSSSPDPELVPNPEVILYGPEGDYSLSPRAYTEDNTRINFPAYQVALSQQVFKRRCLTSPDMTIDDYVFDLTTDIGTGTATATVTGSANDDDGILRIEFWLDGVKVHVIDYSATAQLLFLAQTDVTSGLLPTSVDFSYDFDLTAGTHTLQVVAVDGAGEESSDEWEVAVNTAPVATGDAFETVEDTPLDIAVATLLANDSDADQDPLVVDSFTATTQGELVDNGSGTLTYTPNPNYHGADSFTYTISDGRGGTATATVNITVMSVNDPPLASDDAYSTDEDVARVVAAPGVLANDSDVDGDALSVSLETAPAHGTVVMNADGAFSYTPDADYHGSDGFSYVVSDGNGGTGTGNVSLTIHPVNDLPVANADGLYSTNEDVALVVAAPGVLTNDTDVDGDALTVDTTPVSGPLNGGLSLIADGSFTYTPNPNYYGADGFTYQVSDSNGGTDTGIVSLFIYSVNDLPLANDDVYDTDEDVALVVAAPGLLANDTDVDGDALTVDTTPVSGPSNGGLSLNADGSFTYTPNPDYYGSDSFTYVVSDGNGGADVGSVSLTVNPVNDPPVVSVDVASQSVQYSDRIATVTISAVDVDSKPTELTASWTELASVSPFGDCSPSADGSSCSWTLDGQVEVGAGSHTIALTLNDGEFAPSIDTDVVVTAEDASAAFDDGNPVSVRVATDGGNSGDFALIVQVTETVPDLPVDLAEPGDITLADVSMSLVPVGPGGAISSITPCSVDSVDDSVPVDDSAPAVRTVTCSFFDVPVETYTVAVTIGGDYYTGSAENVLTVYDPSLGFTTGGGWFYWPNPDGSDGDKTNFGYTMKYGKNGRNVRGSLLLIRHRHLADGGKYRIKSNALSGLAIGQDASGPYGWASFSGKSTYLEPGMPEPEGNHGFTAYVEDRNDPGSGEDRFWITTRAKDGSTISAMSLAEPAPANAAAIQGGNIVAPH